MKQENIDKVKEAIMDEYGIENVELATKCAVSCLEAVQYSMMKMFEKIVCGKKADED